MRTAHRLPRLLRLAPGDRVGETSYHVVGPFARGGMGALYDVVHETLARRALLKVVAEPFRSDANVAERLLEEARLLDLLRGASVPTVFDAGALGDGRPFFVMEKLDGSDLRRELGRLGVLSVPSALRIVADVLGALDAVHERGVVHGDLKAENIFITDDRRVVLLDLGAAQRLGETRGHDAPRIGTPRSMAPEQFHGDALDERTDLYAIGLLLYELLVGRGPFDAQARSAEDFHASHSVRVPVAPSLRAPQRVPLEVDMVVLRALAKQPRERFVSAADMLGALLEASASQVEHEPTASSWT